MTILQLQELRFSLTTMLLLLLVLVVVVVVAPSPRRVLFSDCLLSRAAIRHGILHARQSRRGGDRWLAAQVERSSGGAHSNRVGRRR